MISKFLFFFFSPESVKFYTSWEEMKTFFEELAEAIFAHYARFNDYNFPVHDLSSFSDIVTSSHLLSPRWFQSAQDFFV